MRVRPVSPDRLVDELVELVVERPREAWTRVLLDGAPAARPREWADALVDPLRAAGRAVVHVPADDFLRPASLRFEHGGRTDPDALYEDALDAGGLVREVLAPLEPGGTGAVLPVLWDAATDRSHRADYVTLPAGGVVLVSGSLLLGRGLPAELTVHLALSPGALARRTPEAEQWTLAAYARYDAEVDPSGDAEIVVLLDNPSRPALVESTA